MFSDPDYDGHEALLFTKDAASGLRALIAIHDTTLGPAFGGCRMYPYASEQHAMSDVLRLSRGMTYKAAICELIVEMSAEDADGLIRAGWTKLAEERRRSGLTCLHIGLAVETHEP